jgi:hypothetical protein
VGVGGLLSYPQAPGHRKGLVSGYEYMGRSRSQPSLRKTQGQLPQLV